MLLLAQIAPDLPDNWWKLALVVAGIFAAILAVRFILRLNRLFVGLVFAVGLSLFGLHMLYNRTEPKWLTPLFDALAKVFPTRQHQAPEVKPPK